MDFLYEKELSPAGIAIEMIYGGEEKSAKVWKLFAMQIFSEAEGDYREVSHYDSGAPCLEGIPRRISISHTAHCMAIATLPKTPEISLAEVNPRTALGIDLEKSDRRQVLKIRDKFLTTEEIAMVGTPQSVETASDEEVERHILAWTCKEALYKAAMGTLPDWKEDYRILSLPTVAASLGEADRQSYGKGMIGNMDMILSSWRFEGHIITIAFSSKIARFAIGAQ